MGSEMSDLTFEVTEFFHDKQQRFEAALAFATNANSIPGGCYTIKKAVKLADALIAELRETEGEE
jgi:hypothetical protein